MTLQVLNFGCRLNASESDRIRGHAARLSNTIIVNSCAVTAEAEAQVRQAIRRARRDNPTADIIVTGCAVQINPDAFAAMPEVTRLVGNAEKLKAESWQPGPQRRQAVGDIMAVTETPAQPSSRLAGKTRAFVEVQQGCDHRCSFCIIPFGRGPSRSVPAGEVVARVRQLVAAGVKEVVLTGVDVTAYGADLPLRSTLGQLCHRVLRLVPELPRLRLSSLDPVEVDEDIYKLLAEEPRFMPHLHLSVQHGADLILKRMKRRHLRADVLSVVARARAARPDVVFGADLIAGFPTEDAAHFEETLSLVLEANLTYLHVFPFSARQGTPAARMPQLPMALRRARAQRLRALGAEQLERFLQTQVGQQAQVLMEQGGVGHSEHFAPVVATAAPGTLLALQFAGLHDKRLLGVAA